MDLQAQNAWAVLFTLITISDLGWSGCPFQNPFWFVEKPMVVAITDDNNQIVPNRVRIMWGRMENFKCVDYFQVEYFQSANPTQTVQMTPRINRHRRSVEIEVQPCTEYYFKVIASEDWKGMRADFKMFSEVVSYNLEYTPKFIRVPVVKEKRKMSPEEEREALRARLREQRRRNRMRKNQVHNQMVADDIGTTTVAPSDNFLIQVTWRLTDIDYPNCLDYFVLDYYDTLYNETGFSRTFTRPFRTQKLELEVPNDVVPCEIDYEFIIRAFGLNGESSMQYWTPPSCVVTTEAPETTTTTEVSVSRETTEDYSQKLVDIQRENERLQAKIDGLKQEYEKIGLQVFHAFKESFFQGLEDFLARRKSDQNGNGGDNDENGGGGGGLFGQSSSSTNESTSIFG